MEKPIEIKLNFKSLIAVLQGKELHIKQQGIHVIIHPPFDGVFITQEELQDMRQHELHKTFAILNKRQKHEQKI